jgi:4-aminobutyrate aminotransferase-like enzyme/aminoglycoside phosphotransferase (APT) family kinase protein
LLALRTSPPVFSAAQAERLARDIYGLLGSARALPGERDCNFHLSTSDGREFVLKILDLEAGPETVDCQLRVLRHLIEQDPSLPVPPPFPTAIGEETGKVTGLDGSQYTTCLIGFLAGRLLAEAPPERRLLENIGDILARLDHALQGFFHPALGQRLAWDVRRLPDLAEHAEYIESAAVRRDVEGVVAGFRERASALSGLRSQAIHGDCHGQNLLVDPAADNVIGILDFGDMIHAPRILEPAVTMSELLTEDLAPLKAVSSVLEGYARRQPLDPDEIEMLYTLIAARHAVTILVHAWRRRHDPAGARALDGSTLSAARSLRALIESGGASLSREWHGAAGTRSEIWASPGASAELARRHRLMGKGSELFYEKPLHLVRGSGVWLFDPQGHAYLDVYNNVPHVGHAHPAVVRAVQSQAAILATHTRYLHSGILEYAERLLAKLPGRLNACIFVNSGSEANDVAWRMAQFATGRKGALVMQNAYHGITDAVAALTPGAGQPREAHVVTIAPPQPGLQTHDAAGAAQLAAAQADVDSAVRTLAERGFASAAFYIDTALTSSGVYDPPPAWGAAVSERLRAAGALIVADEVQYGMGRPGSNFWGFERRGLVPDIVTLGKPVANGYPMGVVIADRHLIEAFQAKFGFFSTFGGSAVAAAAGLAVLDVLEREELMANAERTGAHLRRRLELLAAQHPCLGELRGAGLLYGLQVNAVGGRTARQCAKRIINTLASQARVLIGYEGPNADILKLRPPMPFRAEHADRLVDAIDGAARSLSGSAD